MPRKYTPPEQALKQYTDYPTLSPIIPEYDSDGIDIQGFIDLKEVMDNMSDSNYIEWTTIDNMYKELIPYEKENVYELTITFDRKIHTYPTMMNLVNHLRIIKYYIEETLDNTIQEWYVVREYHKQPIGVLKKRPPHFHILIQTENEIPHCSLWNLNKAFNRHFGMNTFRSVDDLEKYAKYMVKDVEKNMKDFKMPQLFKIY